MLFTLHMSAASDPIPVNERQPDWLIRTLIAKTSVLSCAYVGLSVGCSSVVHSAYVNCRNVIEQALVLIAGMSLPQRCQKPQWLLHYIT